MHSVLAVLTWDPQIRGSLILLTAVVILCGSVWMLLATNVGARLGFLLAVAGLTGWMMLLGIMWTVTPSTTGPKGRDPRWVVEGVVAGDIGPTAPKPLRASLQDEKVWRELPAADPQRAEIETAASEFLSNDEGAAAYGIEGTASYIVDDAWDRGGEAEGPFGVLNFPPFDVFHQAHYAAFRVQPTVEQEVVPGEAPPEPRADTSKDPLTVLLVRDLGNRRLPVFLFAVGSGILFAVTLYVLHRRDKEAMAARGLIPAQA